MIIQAEPFYLKSLLKRWTLGTFVVVLLLILLLPFDISINYFIGMLLTFILLICVFYLNRKDLASIEYGASDLVFSFVNKSFFKKKDLTVKSESLKIERSNNCITFLQNKKVLAKLRRQSVSSESWIDINNYFGSAISH